MVMGAVQAGYVASVIASGWLADRAGGRSVLTVACLASGCFALAFGLWAGGYGPALLLRFLAGTGIGGTYVPAMVLAAAAYPPSRRGWAIGMLSVGTGLALAATYFLAGPLAEALGWRQAMVWPGLVSFPAAAWAWFATPARPEAQAPPRAAPANLPAEEPEAPGRKTPGTRSPSRWAPALITAGYCGHGWELLGMRAWLVPFLVASFVAGGESLAAATRAANLFTGVVLLAATLAPGMGGWLSDRIGRPRAAALLSAAGGGISLGFGWLGGLPRAALIAVAVAYSLVTLADTAIYKAALTDLLPGRALGLALGVQSSLGFGMGIVSPPLFGLVLDATGNWGWAFASLGVGALAGVAAMLGLGALQAGGPGSGRRVSVRSTAP